MVEIKRKKGESFESFLRRFNRKLLGSGRLLQYKKIRYREPKKSKNLQKQSALVKMKRNEKREYLRKIGKLPEDDFTNRRKRKR
jgi:ribosomal protein S21